jgi:hypothetical protein
MPAFFAAAPIGINLFFSLKTYPEKSIIDFLTDYRLLSLPAFGQRLPESKMMPLPVQMSATLRPFQ